MYLYRGNYVKCIIFLKIKKIDMHAHLLSPILSTCPTHQCIDIVFIVLFYFSNIQCRHCHCRTEGCGHLSRVGVAKNLNFWWRRNNTCRNNHWKNPNSTHRNNWCNNCSWRNRGNNCNTVCGENMPSTNTAADCCASDSSTGWAPTRGWRSG